MFPATLATLSLFATQSTVCYTIPCLLLHATSHKHHK